MGRFIAAANFTEAKRTTSDIWYLVIHDEEYPFKDHAAFDIAEFFHKQARNDSGTSAHRVVDNREIIRTVHWHDIAWAAPGANNNGMHWEQSGYARMTTRDWNDDYGKEQLELLSADIAHMAHFLGIKPVRLNAHNLQENKLAGHGLHRGICGHDTVTAAFPQGSHTDPGPNFPWSHFMERVRYHYGRAQKGC